MDAFGFYVVSEDGVLDLAEFLASNLAGVCRELCPDKAPAVICADEMVGTQTARAVIFYSPEQVEVSDLVTGERYAMQNVYAIHPQAVLDHFAPLMEDVNSLIIALWQTVFHEVRHFVQCQMFGEDACKDMLLTEPVLASIARRNPGAAQCAYNHVKIYASYPDAYNGRAEIDAIIVGLIAVATLLVHSNGGETFDFDNVRRALTSTLQDYRDDPGLLDVF